MKDNGIFKNIALTILAILTLLYLIYNFIHGEKRTQLIIMAIIGVVSCIYIALKNIIIIKTSKNPQYIYQSKLVLMKVILSAVALLIVVSVSIIFFI